jgi:hypothetical protein
VFAQMGMFWIVVWQFVPVDDPLVFASKQQQLREKERWKLTSGTAKMLQRIRIILAFILIWTATRRIITARA